MSVHTSEQKEQIASRRPVFVALIAVLVAVCAVGALVGGSILAANAPEAVPEAETAAERAQGRLGPGWTIAASVLVAGFLGWTAWGMWRLQNWARTLLNFLIGAGIAYFLVTVLFDVSAQIFAGEHVVPLGDVVVFALKGLLRVVLVCAVPVGLIYGLSRYAGDFAETAEQRHLVDKMVRYVLLVTALSSIFVVFLIMVFTMREAWDSIETLGLDTMLLGTVWRPGSIIGTDDAQFGMVPMVVGSILSTAGAVILGVPLSIGAAVLLAEIAPNAVREIVRPAIELLAGIPSVIYGLFGMVVIAPMLQKAWPDIPYNTGYGLLNASVILAVMIIPTVTNIAEDAIRAVPKRYKEGSLALGATRFQTIYQVILPAARSGLIAAVILGIGRALGETMAMIMVIGNSISFPEPLIEGKLWTIVLSTARTLTGNVAVEIAYAEGTHRSALFFTGVMLFVMIFIVNSIARYLMKERRPA
jgi:phosphate transport system permease protein